MRYLPSYLSFRDSYAVHLIRDRTLTPSGEVHLRSGLREDNHLELVERPVPHCRRQSEALDADVGGVVRKERTGIAIYSRRSTCVTLHLHSTAKSIAP